MYRHSYIFIAFAFSALTLLVGRHEEHLACKNLESWGAGVVFCFLLKLSCPHKPLVSVVSDLIYELTMEQLIPSRNLTPAK